jgi:uncharacterized protein with PQ loop repeat
MFLGCLFGLVKQYKQINNRKSQSREKGFATQSLSVNGFFSSFIGFYAFFVYSIMLDPVDYYLFATRFLAAAMTMSILYAIFIDRAQRSQRAPFIAALVAMLVAFICLQWRDDLLGVGRSVASILTLIATVVMVQGGISQIRKINKEKSTGALSKSMNVIFMCKDLSNVAFGLVLDFSDGYPLILLGSCSAMIKAYVLYQFSVYRSDKAIHDS